jgi:protein-serine/threonine kinase
VPSLARSASVREPTTKSHANRQTAIGALAEKSARIEQTPEAEKPKTSRDTKRRTVQVEYVAPQSPTRAEPQSGKTRARTGDVAPVEVASENYQRAAPAPSSYVSPPAPRPVREQQRAISDNVLQNASVSYAQRPSTGGSTSAAGGAPAVVARDQAQGRISQPPRAAPYPEAAQPDRRSYAPRDSSSADHSQIGFPQTVATGAMAAAPPPARLSRPPRGHRRSSTLSGLTERLGFGKRGSLFGSRSSGSEEVESGDGSAEKPKRGSRKNHPPVSMARPMPNDNAAAASGSGSVASGGAEPRKSTDSRRTSFSFSRRSNRDKDADAGAPPPSRSSRRFSLLPSFVRGGNKEDRDAAAAERPPSAKRSSAAPAVRDFRPRMAFGRGESRSPSRSTTDSAQDPIQPLYDSALDGPSPPPQPQQQQHSRSASLGQPRHYPPQQPPTSNPSSSAVPARKPVGSGNTPPGGSPPMHQQQQQPPRSSNNHLQPFQDPYASAPTPGPNGEALMQHNVFYPPPAAGSDRSGASDSAPVIGLAQLQAQQQQHHHHNQQQLLQREPATNFQQMLPESQLQQQLRDEEMLYQQQQQQQAAREKPGVLHKRRGFNEAFDNDGGHAGSSGAARRVMAMFNWKRRTRAGPTVA